MNKSRQYFLVNPIDTDMKTECILAQSKNYRVVSEWETVTLKKNSGSSSVVIGDFYGNPNCGVIDKSEKWCAVAGCGLIIYQLKKPFLPYNTLKKTNSG